MSQDVTDIILNEADRGLVEMAARILAALDPGPTRDAAIEAISQAYGDDVAEVHVGSASGALDELTHGFGRALLLEMERLNKGHAEMPLRAPPP